MEEEFAHRLLEHLTVGVGLDAKYVGDCVSTSRPEPGRDTEPGKYQGQHRSEKPFHN